MTIRGEKEKSILDLITEHAVNERLDALLLCDQKFLALQKEIDEQIKAFDKLDLSKKERQAVDRLICAHTESDAYYSAAAYRLGFTDCASLLSETGLVGKDREEDPCIKRKPQRKEGKSGGGLIHRFYQKILKRRDRIWILRHLHRRLRNF